MMQRAVLAAALSPGRSVIYNPSFSDDGIASLRIARMFGADIDEAPDAISITGGNGPRGGDLDCGESGLCLRMTSAIAAVFDREFVVTGRGSLAGRPVDMIIDPLRALGASCESRSGNLPLRISGPMRGGSVSVDGSRSSQFLTGLLMALPLCPGDSQITLECLRSMAYVRMTLELLEVFGIFVDAADDLLWFRIRGGQRYVPASYTVEGDWSGASFLLVAGAIAGDLKVAGLDPYSSQADSAVVNALEKAGAEVLVEHGVFSVSRSKLQGFEFDAGECPDLFPPLVSLACFCSGKSVLTGTERLRFKESNRAEALVEEFRRMGARIEHTGNALHVEGGPLHEAMVDSHNDHRIAMACAVAALGAGGPVTVQNEGCVAKSFPDFFGIIESMRV